MPRRAATPARVAPAFAMLGVLALCADVLTHGQAPPPTAPPGPGAVVTGGVSDATGKITGQVLAADTSQPVKRATVSASGASFLPPGTAARETTTDEAGRFEMTGLPAGRYMVTVRAQAPLLSPPTQSIQLATGGTAAVTFRIDRGGVITGRVLDHEGDPILHAQVSALQRRNFGGPRRLVSTAMGASTSTDDQGQFRLYGLPPGEYYVSAAYTTTLRVPDPPVADGQPRYGYAPTLYPSSLTVDLAQRVFVRAGQDTGGVEVWLVRARLGTVSGRATDAAGNPIAASRGHVSLVRSEELAQSGVGGMRLKEDGTFVIADVPPGRYILAAMTGTGGGPTARPREGAFMPVVVDGDDVVVDIQTNLGATVSGRVVVEGSLPVTAVAGGASAPPYRVHVSVRSADSSLNPGSSSGDGVDVDDDLTFRLAGLRGMLVPEASGPRMVLKSVTRDGEDIIEKGLSLTGTEAIDGVTIRMTTEVAQIDGSVVTAAGDPADAWVLVFPEDASRCFAGSPFVRLSRTRSESASEPGSRGRGAPTPGVQPLSVMATRPGGFVLNGLLPGRYAVAVLPVDTTASTMTPAMDPDALEKLRPDARIVTAVVGQPSALQLRLPK